MVTKRLGLIFSNDELNRIQVVESLDVLRITADVHGMKCYEAKRFINNIINIVRTAFQLVIIHGYNHGTAIKDMLAVNFKNIHVSRRFEDPRNQGITYMFIAA